MDEGIWNSSSSITCPVTHSLLQQLSVCECSFGYVYFSVLSPHTYIDPHCGATNAKLRLQLPLIHKRAAARTTTVFSDCSITVNGECRPYVPGKVIVFDDSFTHSVRNDGDDSERVVLLVDLWHPDLTSSSIAQISSCFSVRQTSSMFDEGHFNKFPVRKEEEVQQRPASPYSNYDYLFKFLLVGSCGAGKSAFVLRWADDTFTDSYMSTIGVDFKVRSQDLRNSVVKVQMWDTAGPERFRSISSAYYKGAHVILLLADITESASTFYRDVDYYLGQIHEHAQVLTMVFVVGTKVDLELSRQISYEDARAFVSQKGCQYFEVSSKTTVGVHELMHHAVKSRLMKFLHSSGTTATTNTTNTGPPPSRSSWRRCSLS